MDTFERGEWGEMQGGVPALTGALAVLDCEIVEEKIVGQHSVLFLEVRAARLKDEKDPLVHFDGKFCELLPIV
jgi:flavin reductase (DIM6/NTAB) family NADH-FMN oxidoreductase RutF